MEPISTHVQVTDLADMLVFFSTNSLHTYKILHILSKEKRYMVGVLPFGVMYDHLLYWTVAIAKIALVLSEND